MALCTTIFRPPILALTLSVILLNVHGYQYSDPYPEPNHAPQQQHYAPSKQNNYQYEQYSQRPQSLPASPASYNNYYRDTYGPPPQYAYKKYYKQYLPGPQNCPETGKTVCNKLSSVYPIDDIYSVVKMARAKRFNISSEFVDESENDSEPHFEPMPEPEPVFHQLPPRFRTGNGFHIVHPGSDFSHPEPIPGIPFQEHGGHDHGGGHGGGGHVHIHNFDYDNGNDKGSNRGNRYYGNGNGRGRGGHGGRYKRQAGEAMEPICRSRVILIEPKAGMNDKSEWKFVVNLSERDPRLKQAIKVEVCATPNAPCSTQVSLPFGFVSRCRQKYIKKKLMSLDASGQSISSENFFAPSCCVCEVVRDRNQRTSAAAAASNIHETLISSPNSNNNNKK